MHPHRVNLPSCHPHRVNLSSCHRCAHNRVYWRACETSSYNIYSKLHTCTLNATFMTPTCIQTQTIDTFGASALMVTSYIRMYMFKVLIQNYTTCEGCMVIDAACTKYKLNSKECWSNSRQCVEHVYKLQWSSAAQHTLNWCVGLHVQLVLC